MRPDDIKDYESREQETAESLLTGSTSRKSISILDFYPEFKGEGGIEGKVYTCDLSPTTSLLDKRAFQIPLWVLIPNHEVVVVGLEPLESNDEFRNWYGVDVNELARLVKLGRVRIRINSPLGRYMGLDYLDSILDFRPPTAARSDAFVRALVGDDRLASIREQSEKLLKERGVVPSLEYFWQRAGKWKKRNFPEGIANNYVRLTAMAMSGIPQWAYLEPRIHEISSKFIGNEFATEIRRLYLTEAAPVFRALDGTEALPSGGLASTAGKVEPFPAELAQELVRRLHLYLPDNLDRAVDVYPDFRKVRKALFELDRGIQSDTLGEVKPKVDEYIRECNEMAKWAERGAKLISSLFVAGGYVAGVLPGVLASAGVAAGGERYARRVSDTIVKLRKPRHIIELYDLARSAAKWEKKLRYTAS
jgi:hypothetical protein